MSQPNWLSGEKARLENTIRLAILEQVRLQVIEELEKMDIDDTGKLAESVKANITKNEVVFTAKYGKFVEEGRKPGRKLPPYDKIRRWVGHKLGITSTKKARNVTWAIMMKIKKEGIPGAHVIQRAWRYVSGKKYGELRFQRRDARTGRFK